MVPLLVVALSGRLCCLCQEPALGVRSLVNVGDSLQSSAGESFEAGVFKVGDGAP